MNTYETTTTAIFGKHVVPVMISLTILALAECAAVLVVASGIL